ncbi:helix-turn-helix domain-containing protein [Eubacteriaceae bacterium ES2]|nr:helix-turn-helix domain-containing protein [Eubacteriaceae bacterium ES2]
MKISMAIIKAFLNVTEKDNNTDLKQSYFHLQRPVFYAQEEVLISDILYISHASRLFNHLRFQPGAALICLGNPPDYYFNQNLELLILDAETDIFDLSNSIHELFSKYEVWDLTLQQGIRDKHSLQTLLETSLPIFENGLSIMNADYFMIARIGFEKLEEEEELKLGESGRIPIKQVNHFKNDPKYADIKNKKDVFLYTADSLPFRTLCKNIFLNQKFLFRLILSEINHPFTTSDAQLLEHMSQYLIQDTSYLEAFHENKYNHIIALLESVCTGQSFSQTEIIREFKKINWAVNHTYCVAQINPSSQDVYNATSTYFCNVIMQEFKESLAFSINQTIFVVFNTSLIQDILDNYFNRVNRIVKDGNFQVGYSHYTDSLNNLRISFREAEIAIDMGIRFQPQKWIHKFCDMEVPYILNKITEELPAQSLFSTVVTRLKIYDDQNQTDYVKTLRFYLANNMNAVQTAKDLFIHRATMVYRLERIKELGQTDLKNKDELFHISLTFLLMDSSN